MTTPHSRPAGAQSGPRATAAFDPTPFWKYVERAAAKRFPPQLENLQSRVREAVDLVMEEMTQAEARRHLVPSIHKAIDAAAAKAAARVDPEQHKRRDPNVFWAYARRFLESRFVRDPEVREDLSSEALLKLERAFVSQEEKGHPIDNPEALMTLIANSTRTDYIRRITRWRLLLRPLGEEIPDPADPGPPPDELPAGDPLETLWWAVRQHFAKRYDCPSCLEINDRMLIGDSHKEIAARFSLPPNTVTQRWKRCCDEVRALFGKEPL